MGDVCLIIDGQIFNVKKDVLCEHSDYFRAMFSGNYVENEKQEISIDMVDADTMRLIFKYMEIGLIDLSEHSLATIGELAVAANFLQITELIKQIEYCLDLQLSPSNWMQILGIAESSSYSKLEQLSSAFGLLSFKAMKPEYVPSIQKLYWYLSHPYLDTLSELDVFKFGLEWITHNETGADALMIILCCLDVKRLTASQLAEMKSLVADFANSLGSKVVDCLHELSNSGSNLSPSLVTEQKTHLCEMFTERVYNEVLTITTQNRSRQLEYVATVPVMMVKDTKPEMEPHFMYTFNKDKGFEQWIEVAEKNLWGWNVVAWGPTKLVVVCGEYGRGTGSFMKDVKVYDTLRMEWIRHGVELPSRRHGGVAVLNDSLFIVGGVDACLPTDFLTQRVKFPCVQKHRGKQSLCGRDLPPRFYAKSTCRVVLDTAIIYDLKQRSYRKIAKLPDAIQSPAVCVHNNAVYAAGHKSIYRYEDLGTCDRWTTVINLSTRTDRMISYNGYIYCTQNYFNHLNRFRPDEDSGIQLMAQFYYPPTTICNLGNRLVFFTMFKTCRQVDVLAVEEYTGTDDNEPRMVWSKKDTTMMVNEVAGSCALVLTIPPVNPQHVYHHNKYLANYSTFK